MKLRALPLYAAAHFWVDFSCAALVLGRLDDGGAAVTALLIYNFFAFAVQMPVGLLADALGGARRFSVLGCGLAALAWGLPGLIPAAICAGLGNACFHVGGGLYTLSAGEGCGPLGLFVSPGAMGIYLGGLLSVRTALPGALFWMGLLALGAALALAGRDVFRMPLSLELEGGPEDLPPLICLFVVVLLRSLLGNLFAFPWKGELGLLLACAVVGGKAAGGLLADRFGRMRTAWISLALAVPCFLFSEGAALGLIAGQQGPQGRGQGPRGGRKEASCRGSPQACRSEPVRRRHGGVRRPQDVPEEACRHQGSEAPSRRPQSRYGRGQGTRVADVGPSRRLRLS